MALPASIAQEYLGTGPSNPMLPGPKGIPDITLSKGKDAVRDAVRYLLQTFPGDLPWDPLLGLDPEQFRFDGLDEITEDEIRQSIEISLGDAEPRILNVEAVVERDVEGRIMNVDIHYDLIRSQVDDNRVILPLPEHDDAVRPVSDQSRSAVVGFHSATAAAFGLT